jgi:hypothetical protein
MGRLNLISGLPVIQTVRAFAIARFRQTGSEDLMAFENELANYFATK